MRQPVVGLHERRTGADFRVGDAGAVRSGENGTCWRISFIADGPARWPGGVLGERLPSKRSPRRG